MPQQTIAQPELPAVQKLKRARAIDTMLSDRDARQVYALFLKYRMQNPNPLDFTVEDVVTGRDFAIHHNARQYFEAHRDECLSLLSDIFSDCDLAGTATASTSK